MCMWQSQVEIKFYWACHCIQSAIVQYFCCGCVSCVLCRWVRHPSFYKVRALLPSPPSPPSSPPWNLEVHMLAHQLGLSPPKVFSTQFLPPLTKFPIHRVYEPHPYYATAHQTQKRDWNMQLNCVQFSTILKICYFLPHRFRSHVNSVAGLVREKKNFLTYQLLCPVALV